MKHSIVCVAVAYLATLVALIGPTGAAPPDVTTKAQPQTQLYIRTVPPDAKVQVDGTTRGKAPMLIALPPEVEKVMVEVELDGFLSQTREIVVRGGRVTRVELKLREQVDSAEPDPTLPFSEAEATIRRRSRRGKTAAPLGNKTQEVAKLGRLDLRIVPTREDDSQVSLSQAEIVRYEKQLSQEGPFVGRDRGDPFGWYQLEKNAAPDLITSVHEGRRFILLSNRPSDVMLAIGWNVGPWKLKQVEVAKDQRGQPTIGIQMDQAGGRRMAEITKAFLGSRLAILVDNQVISMPTIRAPIGQRIEISGSFTLDEVQQLVQKLQAGVATPGRSQASGERERHFVRLVVSKDKMTFEGQPTTWEKLPESLQTVPDRPATVLEIAIASDEMSVRQQNQAQSRAGSLAHRLGFEYPSFIGVHPLGSQGTPSQKVPVPGSDNAESNTGSPDIRQAQRVEKLRSVFAQIRSLSLGLKLYELDTGVHPSTQQGLEALESLPSGLPNQSRWRGPYLEGRLPVDPWNRPYRYRLPGKRNPESFDLWSIGPDRVDGTDDDIGNWQPKPPGKSSSDSSFR